MNLATIKTSAGFLKSLVRKYIPFKALSANSIEEIYNYRAYHNNLCSSGQPSAEQFELIREAGYRTIINLAPHDAENSLDNEEQIVNKLGMEYIHIPVNFAKPSERKFQLFVDAYQPREADKVWVHCAANMRVSAFLYRYRRDILAMPDQEAREIMQTVWEPFGAWKEFLQR